MKKHLLLLLKTLINNNACVEAARTREKKYNIIPVVFALFALFFSALPICITSLQVKGENWISTTNSVDDGLYKFGEDNKSNTTVTMTIKASESDSNKHVLDFNSESWRKVEGVKQAYDYPTGDNKQELSSLYRYTYIDKPSPSQEDAFILEIYYFDNNVTDSKTSKKLTFAEYYSYLAQNINPYNTDQHLRVKRKDDGSVESNLSRNNSFIVFSEDQIFCANFNLKSAGTTKGSLLGDFNHTDVGTDLLHKYFVEADKTSTLNNWKAFFNDSYINIRWNKTWQSTGIVLGINGGVLIFMGFMVWVLTRGKNNPFRIYSFWDGQKIAYFASLTPGLLSLFGFLSSSFAMMLFVLICGVRVMWLSMRTLRYTAPAK